MKLIRRGRSLLRLLGFVTLSAQLVQAGDVITVDNFSDQPVAGMTTLREAIELANTMSGAEIVFDPTAFSTPQTITLESGDMIITEPMKIIGPGSDLLTIDADNQSRIFTLYDDNNSTAVTVTISEITFTNGNGESSINNGTGGCIMSLEKLKLIRSVVNNCSASVRGGGVRTHRGGNLIENSMVLSNSAGVEGGGLFHQGSFDSRIVGSTFSGNSAADGGGVYVKQTEGFDVINSTIINNQANTGAGISSTSTLNINHSTIVDNLGEGVSLRRDIIQNSIVAGNTDGDCVFSETGFTNLNNLDTDGSCGGDESVGHITVADPMLEPLAMYGGMTLTQRPLPGSLVIDAGDDFVCAEIDQRGELRPQDGDADDTPACDIGAVELTAQDDVLFQNGFDGL